MRLANTCLKDNSLPDPMPRGSARRKQRRAQQEAAFSYRPNGYIRHPVARAISFCAAGLPAPVWQEEGNCRVGVTQLLEAVRRATSLCDQCGAAERYVLTISNDSEQKWFLYTEDSCPVCIRSRKETAIARAFRVPWLEAPVRQQRVVRHVVVFLSDVKVSRRLRMWRRLYGESPPVPSLPISCRCLDFVTPPSMASRWSSDESCDATRLAEALIAGIPALTSLSLRGVFINGGLSKVVARRRHLGVLDLTDTGLQDNDLVAMADDPLWWRLTEFDVSSAMNIGDPGMAAIARSWGPGLHVLRLALRNASELTV